jgi:hypothetical protein
MNTQSITPKTQDADTATMLVLMTTSGMAERKSTVVGEELYTLTCNRGGHNLPHYPYKNKRNVCRVQV